MIDPSWFGGMTIVGIAAAAWRQIRATFNKITSLVFVRLELDNDILSQAAGYYFWRKFSRSPFGAQKFSGRWDHIRNKNKSWVIVYETLGSQEPNIFWRGWRPIAVSISGNRSPGQQDGGPVSPVKITFLRGMFKAEDLVLDIAEVYSDFQNEGLDSNVRKRFTIYHQIGTLGQIIPQNSQLSAYPAGGDGKPPSTSPLNVENQRLLKFEKDQIGYPIPEDHKALDYLYFPDSIYEAVAEMQRWLKSKKWHQDKEIPWRRGWCLEGPPGTGKTSLVRAIAQDCDLPLIILDLSTMTSRDLFKSWEEAIINAPCIALFEDIDTVFDGRKNIRSQEHGVAFDAFINCLGGAKSAQGVFSIITTNIPDKLDAALMRPGRVDRRIHLPALSETGRKKMARRILIDAPELIPDTVKAGEGETGAQFQERCGQLALKHFWKTNTSTEHYDANHSQNKTHNSVTDPAER